MKVFVVITTGERYCVSGQQYADVTRPYPQGNQNGVFLSVLPADDERTKDVLATLKSFSHVPWSGTGERQVGEYWISYRREYDRTDFAKAPLLVPQPRARAELAERQLELKDDLLHLEPKALKKKAAFQDYCWGWVVVRKEARDALLKSDLKHVAFRPVKINSRAREWDTDELWELSSTLCLPPLAPPTLILHNDLTPFTGDHSRGLRCEEKASEGYYAPPEFHYRASDVACAESFDLAYTHEEFTSHFAQGYRKVRKLVASQRFYQFCEKNGFKTEWIPVRINAD